MVICSYYKPVILPKTYCNIFPLKRVSFVIRFSGVSRIRASMVGSYESSSDFVKRMEQAWLISQQPRPVSCSSCSSKGLVECKWCGGTGFFILGDKMLCQIPSRNTNCVICSGRGLTRCEDCKGTGFRAVWLKPPQRRSG